MSIPEVGSTCTGACPHAHAVCKDATRLECDTSLRTSIHISSDLSLDVDRNA
jgi:hypothetical protein